MDLQQSSEFHERIKYNVPRIFNDVATRFTRKLDDTNFYIYLLFNLHATNLHIFCKEEKKIVRMNILEKAGTTDSNVGNL